MKIGLAACEFINNNVWFNVSQIEKAMKSMQGKVNLLCFGEAFLQGFDALTWVYENDKHIAVSTDSDIMRDLCGMAKRYKLDLMFGYIERYDDAIYSSYAVIEHGELTYNYRRTSRGWKEYQITDGHYKEGAEPAEFLYRGRPVMIALCGDMWDFPERFRTDGLLIWPISALRMGWIWSMQSRHILHPIKR